MKRAGIKPSTYNLILGRKLNGEDFGINFDAQNNLVTSIIAGSGSGKGVVTLNILASMIACGSPVAYVDYKPDMSSTLWVLERELGVPILSIDAKENQHKFGATPVRMYPYGMNAPQGFGYEGSFWSIVPYLKMVQLACVVASLRSSNSDLQKDGKIYFIFDELQTMNAHFGEVISTLEKFIKNNKKDESKKDLVEYATKFVDVFKVNLKSAVTDFLKTMGRNGLVGCIVLGQSVNPDDWKFGDLTWKNSPLVTLLTDSNYRLAGAKHRSSKSGYSLDGVKYDGDKFINDNVLGYFACHANYVPPDDGKLVTVIKSYLTLNDNDVLNAVPTKNIEHVNPSTFTGSLLAKITDMSLRKRIYEEDFLNKDGSVNERIGFAGLMKGIIKDLNNVSDNEAIEILKKNLSKSYHYMEEIFDIIGLSNKYSCIEEYLFDCSYDSIFTYGELKSGVSLGERKVVIDSGDQDWLNINTIGQGVDEKLENNVDTSKMVDNIKSTSNHHRLNDTIGNEHDVGSESIQMIGQQPSRLGIPVCTDEYVSPNRVMKYEYVYEKELDIPFNPFSRQAQKGSFSVLKALQILSDILMKEILQMVGDYSRITTVEVDNGGLVINGVAFRPKISQEIIDSLPFDIKIQVEKGNITELFNFQNLYKFKNMRRLMINNIDLAESRLRKELGIGKSNWVSLYKRMSNLDELYIGGVLVTDDGKYEQVIQEGYSLKEKLIEKLGKSNVFQSSSLYKKVWENRAVQVTSKALGWTVAVKGATTIAMMLGGWGLVFGALFGYGVYKNIKK